jgi:hypothetical protein
LFEITAHIIYIYIYIYIYVYIHTHTHTELPAHSCTRYRGPGYQKSRNQPSPVDIFQWPEKQTMPGGLNRTTHIDSLWDFSKNKMDKIVARREGKKKYPVAQRQVCAAHNKRSKTRYISKFRVVPLHKGSCFD